MDPLVEKYPNINPMMYTANNPIMFYNFVKYKYQNDR